MRSPTHSLEVDNHVNEKVRFVPPKTILSNRARAHKITHTIDTDRSRHENNIKLKVSEVAPFIVHRSLGVPKASFMLAPGFVHSAIPCSHFGWLLRVCPFSALCTNQRPQKTQCQPLRNLLAEYVFVNILKFPCRDYQLPPQPPRTMCSPTHN